MPSSWQLQGSDRGTYGVQRTHSIRHYVGELCPALVPLPVVRFRALIC
jgi:hypothetical protein